MTTISTRYHFDLEDKVGWDELAPSLQDKFAELWNKLYMNNAWIDDRTGGIRVTIAAAPPSNPVEYCELWFDTRFMIWRTLRRGNWELTRAAWYPKDHTTVTSTPEAPLSTNDRTNCHCYTVKWNTDGYCHCKSQLWDSSTVPEGTKSNVAFNQKINNAYTTTRYKWIIKTQMDACNIQTLNAYTKENPNTNAIIPMDSTTRVTNEKGESVAYVTFDSKYDPLFDENTSTSFVFNTGTFEIPFTFAKPIKLTGIFGRLASYSNGPLTIQLYGYANNAWNFIAEITLAGNPQYAQHCHRSCHCRRW